MRLLALLLLTTICSAQNRVHDLAKAIAKAEGYYQKGTIPNRYHNAGDLRVIRGYRFPGQTGVGKGGHVIFRDDASGWSALENQINKIIDGTSRYNVNMTIQEIGKWYAKNSRTWSRNVAHNLGVSPNTELWGILEIAPILEESWLPREHNER